MHDNLTRLRALRESNDLARRGLLARVEARGDTDLTAGEAAKFEAVTAAIKDVDQQIREAEAEYVRSGRGNPDIAHVLKATTRTEADDWAQRAFDRLSESRALVSSGSVDVPHLISPNVVPLARSSTPRLIDLLVNRQVLTEGPAFEYFQQTVRTNLAAFTADGITKPTSTFTVTPVQDRARVIATLTEPAPVRLLGDARYVVEFLEREAVGAVLDALENQIINGDGTGENIIGILDADSDVTTQAFSTDAPTTIRKGITALQQAGETPNALVINPADAEALDLFKEGSGGVGFLTDGFTNGNGNSANVYGTYQRVISNSVPAGSAVLGDWSQAKLWIRESMRLDTDFAGELFTKNQFVLRAETRVGFGLLRPSSFKIIDLTAGT